MLVIIMNEEKFINEIDLFMCVQIDLLVYHVRPTFNEMFYDEEYENKEYDDDGRRRNATG